MIHALQANTLLAASLPQEPPAVFDDAWVRRGIATAQVEGIGHALFHIRLLHLATEADEGQRLSFLYGIVLAGEITRASFSDEDPEPILLSGRPSLTALWQRLLCERSVDSKILDESCREAAYLHGLRHLAGLRSKRAV